MCWPLRTTVDAALLDFPNVVDWIDQIILRRLMFLQPLVWPLVDLASKYRALPVSYLGCYQVDQSQFLWSVLQMNMEQRQDL